jgi:hypothetical protein
VETARIVFKAGTSYTVGLSVAAVSRKLRDAAEAGKTVVAFADPWGRDFLIDPREVERVEDAGDAPFR